MGTGVGVAGGSPVTVAYSGRDEGIRGILSKTFLRSCRTSERRLLFSARRHWNSAVSMSSLPLKVSKTRMKLAGKGRLSCAEADSPSMTFKFSLLTDVEARAAFGDKLQRRVQPEHLKVLVPVSIYVLYSTSPTLRHLQWNFRLQPAEHTRNCCFE